MAVDLSNLADALARLPKRGPMILRITVPAFADLLVGKCRALSLPDDMECERVFYDIATDCILLRCTSSLWPQLEPQHCAMELRVMCERIELGERQPRHASAVPTADVEPLVSASPQDPKE